MKNNKSGISLVILVVTIVILTIIAAVGITVSSNMIDNSKKATFASDLTQIQDLVKEYFVNNGDLPYVMNGEDKVPYTKEEFLDMQDLDKKIVLEAELAFNNDDADDNVFYRIDLAKIGIESASRGTDTLLSSTDMYVVSEDNMIVYYFQGYEINDVIYYSLTDKLVEVERIDNTSEEDNSTITVTDVSDIRATKSTELKTNTLGITINGTLEAGESLQYKINGQSAYTTITTLPTTINIDSSIFTTTSMKETFNSSKQMVIEKVGTNQKTNVNLENLDIQGPTVTSYTIDRTATGFNIVNVVGTDISNYYYEYLTKIDTNGTEVPYYDTAPTITTEYLKSLGKKTDKLVLDKSIQSISVILEDDAGNVTTIYTVDNISVD